MHFPTELVDIEKRLKQINPELYARTRNFTDGAVSYLSPYISRGVISTKQVFNSLKQAQFSWAEMEKFTQELAWRDYWQHTWKSKGNSIFSDLKTEQTQIQNYGIPNAILEAKIGIEAVDSAISELYETGYMHNHMRMYVASICCNIAQVHWSIPAKWLYSHLLDGDLASNHLSWQWVAGTFSSKKYYANQENINHYFKSIQKETFLDIEYSDFESLEVPGILQSISSFNFETLLSSEKNELIELIENTASLIYTYYNLDPFWHKNVRFQRILLLEPSHFKKFPVQQKCIAFALELAKNIPHIKIYVGEFSELAQQIDSHLINYKEHPTNSHFIGNKEARIGLTEIQGEFSSFFSYWKKIKKELEF